MMNVRYLGVVAGAALLVGAASGAQAAPYAYGTLSFSNLTLSGVVGTPGVTITGATVTTSSSANYAGPGTSDSAGGTLATGSNVLQSFAGTGPAPGQNTYTQQLLGGSATRGDARIAGAINANATADVVAEGRLTAVPATAASTGGTSTGISITLAATSTTSISLGFTASARVVAITEGAGEGSSVETNASFTLVNTTTGTTVTTFAPLALNLSASSTNGTGDTDLSTGPTAYNSGPFQLIAGNTYQITLLSGVQERLDTTTPTPPPVVPEPASLALLGMGLLGLGLVRNRRKAV